MSTPPATQPKGLKILMLHGYTQNGPLFHSKTRALEKHLQKHFPGTTLTYPTGPTPLRASEIPGYAPPPPGQPDYAYESDADDGPVHFGWWRRRDPDQTYAGIEATFQLLAKLVREQGPFDGCVGFSQGACLSVIFAALLEAGRRGTMERLRAGDERMVAYPTCFLRDPEGTTGEDDDDGEEDEKKIQAPLRFAVQVSGFMAPRERYEGFYAGDVRTPVLTVMGSLDSVVGEERVLELVRRCAGGEGRVVVHPGGHFVPASRPVLDAVVGFVERCVGGGEGEGKGEGREERVEDMDVPF